MPIARHKLFDKRQATAKVSGITNNGFDNGNSGKN